MQRRALCRSRRELSNEYVLAKLGFNTAVNELWKVCPLSAYGDPVRIIIMIVIVIVIVVVIIIVAPLPS